MTGLFKSNVQRWMLQCPLEANALFNFQCSRVAVCTTGKDETNLKCTENGKEEYYHSTEDALKEAREWFSALDLFNIRTLFVYGVGAGYGYLAAKEWLKEESNRMLVFLEDDLEVIHRLFETPIGNELVNDPQVWLQYFDQREDRGEEGINRGIYAVPLHLFMSEMRITALGYYRKKHADYLPIFEKQLEYIKNVKAYQIMEYMTYGEGFFQNFYRNLLELPSAYLADRSFGEFEGIPAIVCGAGPSLDKNLSVLETLGDRALIIAGGSSLNTLNKNGFLPHFGISVDPNWNQYTRLFMNQAYEVPFFYRNRIYTEALSSLHGDHLYVKGSGGHGVAKWFEQKLGLEGEEIPEGNSVVNFGLSIAQALGCNPIILVGADLAYTGDRSYASGVIPHPILDANLEIRTKGKEEELLHKMDIFGKPVLTLWKWVMESVWMTQFTTSISGLKVINATEGGIGCEGIPNMKLEDSAKKFLSNQFDFKIFQHVEIQNSKMPTDITKNRILGLMEELFESLRRSKNLCKSLRQEFESVITRIEETKEAPANLVTEAALGYLKELNRENAFEAILKNFNESFLTYIGKESVDVVLSKETDPAHLSLQRVQLNLRRYEFLKTVCKRSIAYLSEIIEIDKLRKQISDAFISKGIEEKERAKILNDALEEMAQDRYFVEGDRFHIIDKGLSIDLKGELIASPSYDVKSFSELNAENGLHGHYKLHYPSGRLKMEQYYRDGLLHGPTAGYNEDGKLLAKSWFVNGKREGKAVFYYAAGEFHSMQSYREGHLHGKQLFFFPNGHMKTRMHYQNGKLDGVVTMNFPNGALKREVPFQEGKRNGTETVWNLGGIKELEVTYKDDRPIGKVKSWYAIGMPARQITYDEEGSVIEVKAWNKDGMPISEELLGKGDYFDIFKEQTDVLTGTLDTVYQEVKAVTKAVTDTTKLDYDIGKDLEELKIEMEKLKNINLNIEKGEGATDASEVLWKTPETRRLLGKQMQDAAQHMNEDIKAIEEILKMTIDLWINKERQKMEKQKDDDSAKP